jgi:hypothetical protein
MIICNGCTLPHRYILLRQCCEFLHHVCCLHCLNLSENVAGISCIIHHVCMSMLDAICAVCCEVTVSCTALHAVYVSSALLTNAECNAHSVDDASCIPSHGLNATCCEFPVLIAALCILCYMSSACTVNSTEKVQCMPDTCAWCPLCWAHLVHDVCQFYLHAQFTL